MRNRQKPLRVPEHELVQDVVTRWNSTQAMLSRLVEQRRTLTDILLDEKVTKKADSAVFLPKDHEWELMNDMSTVLMDLSNVTTYMCSENSVSLSEVYPIVCGLIRRSLKVQDSDGVIIRKTKDVISDELNRRYQPNDKTACSTPVIASLMDTRYKKLTFLSSEQRKTAEEFLEGLIDEMPLKRLTETSGSDTPPPKRQRRPSGIDFLLSKSPDKPESQDELELQSYLLDKSDFNKSPLEWWSENKTKYPRLSIIAKRVLAVPATSVPSERIFSCAGLVVTKLRNRLSAGSCISDNFFKQEQDKSHLH
ncbi:E3 SUMO-protein ligase ZBED1-like [Mytilus trossulus]|uniref:E3 SUMO-protein ligase ZBED1-like n=1 Tax=Mytilus trossulus TaxID=6551 RepID=UPI0030052A79